MINLFIYRYSFQIITNPTSKYKLRMSMNEKDANLGKEHESES